MGKEFALLFSLMFLPGLLTQSSAVNAAGWDSLYYHLTLLAVAVPQIFLVVYVTNLRTPGIFPRIGWVVPGMADMAALGIAIVFLLAGLSVITVAASFLPEHPDLWKPAVQWSFSRYELLPLVIVSCMAIGYREEIFYRAYLFVRGEELHLHPAVIIGGSSILFAVGHLYQGAAGFVTALVIGGALGTVFAWRRSLHGIAVAHGLYNAMVLIASSQG